MVKALDSNTSAVFQTWPSAARAGLSSALSDQLTGRDWAEIPPRSWWSGLAAQRSATRECSSPHTSVGVGSNPTPDKPFFFFLSSYYTHPTLCTVFISQFGEYSSFFHSNYSLVSSHIMCLLVISTFSYIPDKLSGWLSG